MINLTVKTLDSRNHQFTVEDDITVEQFKRHIADSVNIPAETQRIIYCGQVLQDTSKLNDYDLDGKVVHLVQRPPPGTNQPSSRTNRSSSPHPQRRVFRSLDHGNTMFVGSVAIPTNLMNSQGLVPPPPPASHSYAGSRLNVASRMLRRAEHVITQLENPDSPLEPLPTDDPQEEVTPVIESIEPLENAIISAVNDHPLFFRSNLRRHSLGSSGTSATSSAEPNASSNSTEPTVDPQGATASPGFPENGTRTAGMAELLTKLSNLQGRWAPFLQRYQDFMRDDPVVPQENLRVVQNELRRVSEVMHYFSHAYHALSDIIVRVRQPPPRPLLCRPILHTAIIQPGIPIQVEAQINLTSDRTPISSTSTASTTTSTSAQPAGETTPPNTTAPTATPQPFPTQAVPLISTVRVPYPLEIRGVGSSFMPNMASTASVNLNRESTATQPSPANVSNASTGNTTPASGAPSGGAAFAATNPEVEFIMELTPDSITIDSLETALIGTNQADDLLRGALNVQQTPNFIQSIMQVAGQIINRRGAQGAEVLTTSQQSSTTSAPPLTPTPPVQNSQARGNNQTNPTSSTNTRSTPRPHVHLQHQAIQGGFDPFLSCNSHHITRSRLQNQILMAEQQGNAPRTEQQQLADAAQGATQHLQGLVNSIVSQIRNTYQRRTGIPTTPPGQANTSNASGAGAGEGNARTSSERIPSAPPADQVPLPNNVSEATRNGPTLSQILQMFPPDESYVPGESITSDFIMLVSRNLTIGDIVSLNGGNIAPLSRMAGEIQSFVLTNLLNGSGTQEAIDSGVERLLTEMRPFLDTLARIPVRDDIDIEESVNRFLRSKLPQIIQLSSTLSDQPNNLRVLVDLFVSTVKELCALALHACADGLQGIDQLFEILATRYMQGIPADLQEWTLITSRSHMRQLLANLNVPFSTIEPHIIRKTGSAEPMSQDKVESSTEHTEEPMETEEASASGNEVTTSPSQILEEEVDALPAVVIGSEPWHNQVPADWVPIIARDAQRQKKQHSQPPFSDAYLSGMPSKRRKLVHGNKGRQGLPLPQVIADSVKKAVTATGLSSVANLETVAQAAGASTDIQTAYRGLLRSAVQEGLRDNEDFTAERFPHAASYFGRL